jgi:hypothetical protein
MTVTQTETNIVNALADVATAVLTTNFKNSKIKEVIFKYNVSVVGAVKILELHTDNLRSKIDLMQLTLTDRSELLLKNATTESEKWGIVYAYKKEFKEIEQIKTLYDKRYKQLEMIRNGHQQLFDNIENLHAESLKKSLTILARDIYGISNPSKP